MRFFRNFERPPDLYKCSKSMLKYVKTIVYIKMTHWSPETSCKNVFMKRT